MKETIDHHARIRELAAHSMPVVIGDADAYAYDHDLSPADLSANLSQIVGHADVLAGQLRTAEERAERWKRRAELERAVRLADGNAWLYSAPSQVAREKLDRLIADMDRLGDLTEATS